MSATNLHQMAGRVAELFEERLNVGGKTLAEKLRRGGKRLPRKVRREAAYLAQAEEQARVPKLMVQIDHARTAHAYDACLRYLKPIGAAERRRSLAMQVITGIGAAIFVTGVLVLLVLLWRGYI
ncbi:MAG: hypothetical protein ACRCS0_08335 [Albidovulum sp.]